MATLGLVWREEEVKERGVRCCWGMVKERREGLKGLGGDARLKGIMGKSLGARIGSMIYGDDKTGELGELGEPVLLPVFRLLS